MNLPLAVLKKMKTFQFIILIVVILCGFASPFASSVGATEDYAEKTGAECAVCHTDPLGGGDLTELGKGYLLSVAPDAGQNNKKPGYASRFVRLIFLYAHIITAFLWFGTILYVHLVLKPAYASKGLPSGEVKVGLVSMAVMAITGLVLTYYKVSTLSQLLSSNFGILLLVKIGIFTIMVLSALFVVFVIGPKLKRKKSLPTDPAENLTLNGLANYDGEEGRPAYFAYNGKIYDVSRSKLWRNGRHMMRHQAGVDLTEILSQAPHGEDKIMAMPEIGELSVKQSKPEADVPRKIFYFMAYMNLGLVYVTSLILALWRW